MNVNPSAAVTILISSCDAYADCWPPFWHGVNKYWPDCPYPLAVISNYKDSSIPQLRAIKVGQDRDWTTNMLCALEQVDTPFLLLTMEDLWISRQVDTAAIQSYVALLEQNQADYIRLYPAPPADGVALLEGRLGTLTAQSPYRTSLQMALWRKSVLVELLRPGENPWQFELLGTPRSRVYGERFLSVRDLRDETGNLQNHYIEYVCTAINKGKWSQEAKDYAQQEELAIDFSTRPHEGWWEPFTRRHWLGQKLGVLVYALNNPKRVLEKLGLFR